MSKHTPVLALKDEPGTPHMRIVIHCLECKVTVVDRPIDVSQIPAARRGEFGQVSGDEDAKAFLQHAGGTR